MSEKNEKVYLKSDIIDGRKTHKKGECISLPCGLVKKLKAKGLVCDPSKAKKEEAKKPDPVDPVLKVLDGTVRDVIDTLPDQTDEDLEKLLDAERAGNTRSTLVEAIEAEIAIRQEADDDADNTGGDGEDSSTDGSGSDDL